MAQQRFFSHVKWHNRLKIEQMYNDGRKPREIADALHFHISTIYRELERGKWEHLNTDLTTDIRYSPDIAQEKAEQNMTALGPDLKIGNDHAYASYLETKIADEGFSPEAVAIAYDRTLIKLGKLHWSYMDKIFQSWHAKKLHTPAEIEAGDSRRRAPAAEGSRTPVTPEDYVFPDKL